MSDMSDISDINDNSFYSKHIVFLLPCHAATWKRESLLLFQEFQFGGLA